MDNTDARARRAIILTALPLEYGAVRKHLSDLDHIELPQGTLYEHGRFQADTRVWDVLIAEVGAGNTSAAVEAERAIAHFHPEVALFVGVAGGLKPDDLGLGDVVIATKVYDYHSGKAGERFLTRPSVERASYRPLQWARMLARGTDWLKRIKGDPPQSQPKAVLGAVAAGEQVVASPTSETYLLIRGQYNDAIAVEMESSGFLSAVYRNPSLDALVIRGISDLVADKEEADRHGSQPVAARHAAAFAFELLARYTRPQSADQSPRIRNVPHPRNPNFTGREGLLNNLHSALTSGEVTTLTQPQAIHGLGGIGKTQIAVEYAYRHEPEYDIVWWVRAEEPAVLASDYAALAYELGLVNDESRVESQMVEITRRWLDRNGKWLLIFDNAPDLASLHNYLPHRGTGHVLITSRNATQWSDAGIHSVPIRSWETGEATAYLIKRIGQADLAASLELVRELGALPLAMAQAAAYIDLMQITISSYLALFRDRQAEILCRGQLSGYSGTVATTWTISFSRIREASPETSFLLVVCAFFAPDAIPRDVLAGISVYLPEPLATTLSDRIAFNDAIALARSYSLLEVGVGGSLSMHQLVQAVVREEVGLERTSMIELVVYGLAEAFPKDVQDVAHWPECSRLLPHVISSLENIERQSIDLDHAIDLVSRSSAYLQEQGQLRVARDLAERLLKVAVATHGPDAGILLPLLNVLGLITQELQHIIEASDYLGRALTIAETVDDIDEKTLATILNNFARAKEAGGYYEQAKSAFDRCLSLVEAIYGHDSVEAGRILNNIGHCFQSEGNLAKAVQYFERALEIDREIAASPYRERAMAKNLNNLGMVFNWQGNLSRAYECMDESLTIYQTIYPNDSLYVIQAKVNLALVLKAQDSLSESRAIMETAILSAEKYADVAPNRLATCLRALSEILFAQNELDTALEKAQRALRLDETEGVSDKRVLLDDLDLAGKILFARGEFRKAKDILHRVLRLGGECYGKDSLHVAQYQVAMSCVLYQLKDLAAAKARLGEALQIQTRKLGKDHEVTCVTKAMYESWFT